LTKAGKGVMIAKKERMKARVSQYESNSTGIDRKQFEKHVNPFVCQVYEVFQMIPKSGLLRQFSEYK